MQYVDGIVSSMFFYCFLSGPYFRGFWSGRSRRCEARRRRRRAPRPTVRRGASACWAERGDHRASHFLAQDLFSSVLSSSPRYMVQSAADGAHFVHGFSCLKITLAACCAGWHVAAQWSGEGQSGRAQRQELYGPWSRDSRGSTAQYSTCHTHFRMAHGMGAGTWAMVPKTKRDAKQDAKQHADQDEKQDANQNSNGL